MSDGGGGGGGDSGGGGGDSGWGGGDNGGGEDYGRTEQDYGRHDGYGDNYMHNNDGSSSSNSCKWFVAVIVSAVIALGFLIGGSALLNSSIKKSNSYIETKGTIVDVYTCSGSDGTKGAIIEYEVDGTTYTLKPSSCSKPGPTKGNDIAVLYDPDDPQNSVDGSFMGLWLFPLICLGIGIPLMLFVCWKSAHMVFKRKHDDAAGTLGIHGPPPPPLQPVQSQFTPTSHSNASPQIQSYSPTTADAQPPQQPYSNLSPAVQSSPVSIDLPTQQGVSSEPVSIFDQLKQNTRQS